MWASRLTKMCNRHLIIAFEADWYLRGVATFRHLTPPAGGVPHSTVISSHWTALIFDLTWTTWPVLPPMKAGNSRVIDVIVASIFYHSQLSLTPSFKEPLIRFSPPIIESNDAPYRATFDYFTSQGPDGKKGQLFKSLTTRVWTRWLKVSRMCSRR